MSNNYDTHEAHMSFGEIYENWIFLSETELARENDKKACQSPKLKATDQYVFQQ